MNPQAMTVKAKQPEGPTVAAADVIDKGLFRLISRQPKTKCKIPNSWFMHQIWDYNVVQQFFDKARCGEEKIS